MAKKKIYAVRKGHKTGLFYTWDECKKQVNGFSGAEYKSFQTLDELEQPRQLLIRILQQQLV